MRLDNFVSHSLEQITLTEADLSGVNLTGTRLGRDVTPAANLERANLTKANLFEAYLVEVNLDYADLSGANLRRADLRKAQVVDAIFEDTLLEEAKLPHTISEEQLSEARFIRQRWELNETVGPYTTKRAFLQRMCDYVDSQLIFEGFENFESACIMAYNLLCAWQGWVRITPIWWMMIPVPFGNGLLCRKSLYNYRWKTENPGNSYGTGLFCSPQTDPVGDTPNP